MSTALESLLGQRRIWRGGQTDWKDADYVPSGFAEFDAHLPGGGWPRGALTEIVLPASGIGELQLLMPALLRLNRESRWIALIAPPYLPYAPAWRAQGIDLSRLLWICPDRDDRLWTIEQTLRAGACGAVLSWPPQAIGFQSLRRLQLAAEAGDCLGILFLPPNQISQATPAALRLRLEAGDEGLDVQIMKARGRTGRVAIRDL